MICTAVIQDGGLFIPNIMPTKDTRHKSTIQVDLRMLFSDTTQNAVQEVSNDVDNSMIQSFPIHSLPIQSLPKSMTQAVGILSDSKIDGVRFQNELRDEWD